MVNPGCTCNVNHVFWAKYQKELHNMKKIVLTGGGTAGHVTPNIALIPALKKRDMKYIILALMMVLKENL